MMAADSGVKVRFVEDVAVVELTGHQKRFNLEYLGKLNKAYDEVLRNEDVKAVITTAQGKFFSNGIDLEWLGQQEQSMVAHFMKHFSNLIMRIMTFPLPTIAAINGHAFAGGAFLALAHDYRVMRTGQGWLCVNEVLINMLIPRVLLEILKVKLPSSNLRTDVVVFGKRYTGIEAEKAGLVHRSCGPDDLESVAMEMARGIMAQGNYMRETLQNMKLEMYKSVLDKRDEYVAPEPAKL